MNLTGVDTLQLLIEEQECTLTHTHIQAVGCIKQQAMHTPDQLRMIKHFLWSSAVIGYESLSVVNKCCLQLWPVHNGLDVLSHTKLVI